MKTQINQPANTNKTALRAGSSSVPVFSNPDPRQIIWGALLTRLGGFIGKAQMQAIREVLRGEEAEFMQQIISNMIDMVETMPATYATDGQGDQAVAQLHYFTGGCDWYITEKDRETEQLQAFGLADLYGDGGELGYISIVELLKVGAELDLHWKPKTLAEVKQKTKSRAR